MDPLFPQIPEKLSEVSDADIAQLLSDHEAAAALIDTDDQEFLKGLTADEIIEQYAKGVDQIKPLRVEHKAREGAHAAFVAKRDELKAARETEDEDVVEETAEAEAEVVAEAEAILEETVDLDLWQALRVSQGTMRRSRLSFITSALTLSAVTSCRTSPSSSMWMSWISPKIW